MGSSHEALIHLILTESVSQSHLIAKKLKDGAVTATVIINPLTVPHPLREHSILSSRHPTADPRLLAYVQAKAEEEQLHENYFLTSS